MERVITRLEDAFGGDILRNKDELLLSQETRDKMVFTEQQIALANVNE